VRQEGVEVSREGVVVVAVPRLRRVPESPAVIGDDPVARVDEGRDRFPRAKPGEARLR